MRLNYIFAFYILPQNETNQLSERNSWQIAFTIEAKNVIVF